MVFAANIKKTTKRNTATIVSYLFSVLFVYAAISKLLDFETFTVQLAQSPLLSAYAGIVAWAVPAVEILISILLTIPRYKILALHSAFTLMVMFTVYIFIILNFSDFIPCSCGGVLEKLSWTQHLIFNVVFIFLAGFSILFTTPCTNKRKLLLLALLALTGISIVVLLFAFSEKKMHRNNAFVRRYPHHPIIPIDTIDLTYNSYYFAGISKQYIYLGNYTAPLNVLRISTDFKDTITIRIELPKDRINYKNPRLRVLDSTFFLADGQVPIINTGSIKNWKVKNSYRNIGFFTVFEPIGKNLLVIRTQSSSTGNNTLGSINLTDSIKTILYPDILQSTGDGYFDRDGSLLFNSQFQTIVYVYYYKNKYNLINIDFTHFKENNTIDTVQNPVLDLKNIKSSNQTVLGGRSVKVNGIAASDGEYLLINSDRLGRYEPNEELERISIIDVYNVQEGSYDYSYYLYRHNKEDLLGLKIYDREIYTILDNHLIKFKMKASL